MNPNLAYILQIITLGATVAEGVAGGDAAKIAQLSAALITIAQKAIAAHEAIIGQPIDASLLKPFDPIQ
jgi:hypothetical protein